MEVPGHRANFLDTNTLSIIVTSSTIDKKLEITNKNLENKLEINKILENGLEILGVFFVDFEFIFEFIFEFCVNFEFLVNGR